MPPNSRSHLPLALVVGAVALYWWPFLGAGFHGGDFGGHLALREMLARSLADGFTLPLWTADAYLGASLVSAYPQAVFSLVVLEPFAQFLGPERGFAVGAVTLVASASAAMYAWAYAWSESRNGALLAALLYGVQAPLIGFVAEEGQMHQPVTLATVPLVFLAWHRFGERINLRRGVLAAIASALLLYDMQRFWMVFPFAVACYFASAIASSEASERLRQARRAAAAAVAVGIGLSGLVAFPALPMLEERDLLQWHPEASIKAYREQYSLASPLQFVDREGALIASFAASTNATKSSATGQSGHWYLGIVGIAVLAFGAFCAARKREHVDRERLARFAGTCAGLGLAMALAFGPVSIFSRSLDFVETTHGSAAVLWTVAMAFVGIAVLVSLHRGLVLAWPARRRSIDVGTTSLAALLVFSPPFEGLRQLIFVYDLVRAPAHFAFPLVPFLLASAASLSVALVDSRLGDRRLGIALGAALIMVHAIDLAPYRERLRPSWPRPVAAELAAGFLELRDAPPGRVLDASGYSPITDWGIARYSQHPAAWGWLSWRSSRHTSELFRGAILPSLHGNPESAVYIAELSGLAHVRYLSEVGRQRRLPKGAVPFEPLVERARLRIYENPRSLDFAQFYPELAILRGAPGRVLPRVAELAHRGVASLTLRPGEPEDGLPAASYRGALRPKQSPADLAAPCSVERTHDERIELECNFISAGFLVVAESWSPHWRVEVDGRERKLLRLNHAFQGVEIQPNEVGRHEVVFAYVTSPVTRGSIAVSLLCWFTALAIAAGAGSNRSRTHTAEVPS